MSRKAAKIAKTIFFKYLPLMETDVSMTSKTKGRKIIIGTKYYSQRFLTQGWPGSDEKLISVNLYQLFSYLKNIENYGDLNKKCEGILLYAAVDKKTDLTYNLPGHQVRIKTINLNQNWHRIHSDLLTLVGVS